MTYSGSQSGPGNVDDLLKEELLDPLEAIMEEHPNVVAKAMLVLTQTYSKKTRILTWSGGAGRF